MPDDVCEGFKTLGDYDFASEVSVTVLGHIFEQSIADVERLQAQARGEETEEERATGTSGRRKRDGVVYTPDYIARFIVAETLGAHLEEAFTDILRAHAKAGADLSDYGAIPWHRKSTELEAWQAYRDRLKTTLTPAQEAVAVVLRTTLLVSIDDLLAVVREFLNPQVSRSGLDRCLRRHGVANLRDLQAKSPRPKHKAFKAYEAGYPLPDRALRSNVPRGGMWTSSICLKWLTNL